MVCSLFQGLDLIQVTNRRNPRQSFEKRFLEIKCFALPSS